MSFLACFFFFLGNVEIKHQKSFVHEVPASSTEPSVVVDRKGNIYSTNYWDSEVYKADSDGNLIMKIGRPGRGPGELNKPYLLALSKDEKSLIIMESMGKIHRFNSETGSSDGLFNRHFPADKMVTTGDGRLFLAGRHQDGNYFHLLDRSGKHVSSWVKMPFDRSEIYSSRHALAITSDNTAYYQEGTYAELLVVKPGQSKPGKWPLGLPKGYVEPPSEPMDERIRFNRVKVQEFYDRFTKLADAYVLNDTYLIVGWDYQGKMLLDMYELKSREIVLRNVAVPGNLVATQGNKLYLWQENEDEPLDGDDSEAYHHKIHVYSVEGLN